MADHNGLDFQLIFIVLLLLLLGLVMVYSSSYAFSAKHFGDPAHLLKKQALAAAVGLALMFLLSWLDYRLLRQVDDLLLVLTLGLTFLTAIPGVSAGGRWLPLGPFNVQPSEALKFALIVYLASTIVRRGVRLRDFTEGVLPYLVVLGLAAGSVLLQPDFGMAMLYGLLTFSLLFVGGARLDHLLLVAGAGLPVVFLLLYSSAYRWERIISFLEPFEYSLDESYQLVQSLTAVGSGGLWGRGLGLGREKFFYLPSAHNDFIFAVIGEELGLLGGLLLLVLFSALIWRGLRIALGAPERFGSLLGVGLTLALGLQAGINLGVAVGLLPVTGLTLPFISYGGSSLVISLAMVGLLLSIRRCSSESEAGALSPSLPLSRPRERVNASLDQRWWERRAPLSRLGDHGGPPLSGRHLHRLRWG